MDAVGDAIVFFGVLIVLGCATCWAYRTRRLLKPVLIGTISIPIVAAIGFQFGPESYWWAIASIFALFWGGLATLVLVLACVALRKRNDREVAAPLESLARNGDVKSATEALEKLD